MASLPAGAHAGRVTASDILTPTESEKPGFGLYSYLLFGSRPESLGSDQWRLYHETIDAFLAMPPVYELLPYVQRARMNLTLLPVACSENELPSSSTPFFHFDPVRVAIHRMEHESVNHGAAFHDPNGPYARADAQMTACILVGNYDYARAQVLLSLFTTPHMRGPYIVSALQPLSKASGLPSQYLYQDLSSVPPQLVPLWVKEFMAQAHEQKFWETRTKEQFILRVRTALAVARQQMPDFSAVIRNTLLP